jgi:transcriptional regulator with XRE-family HTH domain
MDFPTWLDATIEQRGWSRAELARRANLSPSTVSMIFSGRRGAGVEACRAIARALQVPEADVLRAAALLGPENGEGGAGDPVIEELVHLASKLPSEDRQDLIDLARAKLDRRERTKKPARKTSTR